MARSAPPGCFVVQQHLHTGDLSFLPVAHRARNLAMNAGQWECRFFVIE